MKRSAWLVGCVFSFGLFSCTKDSPKEDVEGSVRANVEAKNQLEWDSSGMKPADLFSKWRDEKKEPSRVCEALRALPAQELTLFEDELSLEKNQALVGGCRDELKKKLEAYWAAERPR